MWGRVLLGQSAPKRAARNYITEFDIEDIKILMGVNLRYFRVLPEKRASPIFRGEGFPINFDAREKWPHCSIINSIRNQGNCGSCWAFAAVEVISDRMCIKSNGALNMHISPQNLMTCCRSCGYGCNGGYPEEAFLYWARTGIVSGGDYGSNEGCQPYSRQAFSGGTTPACIQQCQPGSGLNYPADLHFGKHLSSSAYSISADVAEIQKEILENGPVVGCFKVYDDFITYSHGVYMHRTGGFQGDHAIKIIGWGEENNMPYWLCANSWGEEWGMNGIFKILRGHNESGIEQFVITGNV
ncbi:hypothetical protein J437_LFUL007860 [Ladona fulva]|uniref:Peptidase C1A papain C-terminal domain-containing protein n=1 Tax=Ladona fulva TaxID=123851 RepID=A0A8K0JWS4_LADFU|nr:hypothetical protein J437_LFUL007860 [Ladona fulva]